MIKHVINNTMKSKDQILLENIYEMILLKENLDEEYMSLAQNPEENKEELQRMVDDTAKTMGFYDKWFRQDTNEFSVFTPRNESQIRNARSAFGYFFTKKPSNEIANAQTVKKFYIKNGKYFDRDSYGSGSWEQYSVNIANKDAFKRAIESVKSLRDSLVVRGYDGLDTFELGFGTVRVVFPTQDASNKIKLSDPVTYDGEKIIPLSRRFDSSKDDIRY